MSLEDLLGSPLVKQQLLDMPLFRELIEEYSKTKPFTGQKIAIAHVLVPNTLPLIISCIAGGAMVKITDCIPGKNDPEVLDLLNQAGLSFDHEFHDASDFDYAIDVNAYFMEYPPKKGISEITRSGIHKFQEKSMKIPIIDCDNTRIKTIETFLGNPLSVEKAFDKFIGNPQKLLKDKKVIVMGFGKIGRGLARVFGEYAKVLILDIDLHVIEKARSLGFDAELITDDLAKNNKYLNDTKVIFTATGHPNVVSTYFNKNCLNANYLINIGAVDEFGDLYSEDEVFMSKHIPFNFNLVTPTENQYIDPTLVAHVRAVEYMINNNDIENGVVAFPTDLDTQIIKEFESNNYIVMDLINQYFDL